ncbi:MAG: hypothetical protein NDI69_13905 [Bacteriovoracaceae bacterium]|nr:hypothetical protein [Bacteriovoracaceae bacterium]
MSAFKMRPEELAKLYGQDKKIVESLIKRLNDKLLNDPKSAKKAALIIEQWLKKTKP